MKSYLIYLNYDPTTLPIGRVELDEDRIPEDMFTDIAIVPMHIKNSNDEHNERWRIVEFGMISRTMVDTRPREELGRP